MMKPDALTFALATEDFDVSLLPAHARDRNTPAFRDAVQSYLQDEFRRFGGWSSVQVDAEGIEVSWTPDRQPPDPLEQIIGKLQRRDYSGAITLLQLFLSDRPNDVALLYNLGMALSDVGRLAEAEEHLQHVVELAPDHVNARVALGVALQRLGQSARAIEVLHAAVDHAPDNLWAQRNLGACLLSTGQFQEAEECLRKATLINADDQQSWYGLAQARERLGKIGDADAAYRKTIDVDEYSPLAEMARDALRAIAEKTFRDTLPGITRPDAVMYCLGAIEKFEKMSRPDVQRVAFEIATLGTKGLNVNDPAQEYRLKSLPGSNLEKHGNGWWGPARGDREKISVPKNLFVVGTVNVDETTYLFSPKVLDRATTFELRVETADLSVDARKPVSCVPGGIELTRGLLAIAADDQWHLEHPARGADTFVEYLKSLHELLAEGGFEFGHRVFYEAVRFAAMFEAAGDSDPERALDRQIMQKVLPRLHGSRRRLEPTLCALGQFCFELRFETGSVSNDSGKRFDPLAAPSGLPRLPISFDKVRRMTRGLRAQQFTSFTE